MTAKKENKVEYGLENVHIAVVTDEKADGTLTYDTPFALPGAVEVSLEPEGEEIDFQADNRTYYGGSVNKGYTGTLTVAKTNEKFLRDVLGEVVEQDGTISEIADVQPKSFAMMFQFEGDTHAIRHVLYNCSVSRPKLGSKTKSGDPNTTELNFKAVPRGNDKRVKNKTGKDVKAVVYKNWFKKVHEPETKVEGDTEDHSDSEVGAGGVPGIGG